MIAIRFINSADSFVGRMIDLATFSLIDHVEFGTRDNTWIGAHHGTGVQERAFGYCIPTLDWRYDLPCTDKQYEGVIADSRALIGTRYDDLGILGLLVHDRSIYAQHRVICSQFVTDRLQARGIELLNVLPEFTHLITPEVVHLSPLFIGRRTYSFPPPRLSVVNSRPPAGKLKAAG